MDRTKVKALMQKDMHNGSLQSSNISSLIKQVDEINKDNNKIAIICDITTFAGIGDLIIFDTKSKRVGIFECKEGKINSLIQEAVDQRNVDILKKHVEILPDIKSKKYFAKQVLRFFNQEKKMFDALNIMNKGEGFNHYFKKPSKSIEIDVKPKNFSIFINRVLNEFYTLENEEVFIPFDCGELGILKGSGMARKWDFQHHIYHLNSKAVCPYLKHNPKENPNESLPHLFDYCRLPIFTLNELVFLSTHVPIYFLLSEKYVLDILAGRLTIATYFDSELFRQLCKKNKLEFKFKSTSECSSEDLQHLAVFNDNVIELSYKSKSILLTKGLLYRITYEFEFGEFVVKQIKELIIKIK